jgi:hypothetical protein
VCCVLVTVDSPWDKPMELLYGWSSPFTSRRRFFFFVCICISPAETSEEKASSSSFFFFFLKKLERCYIN